MGTNTAELYELHKITKLTVFYENERLVFITKIPLITGTELILYNAIPIPMVRTLNYGNSINTRVNINPENPYIAITKDRREYTTFTEIQIQTCKETTIYRICHAYQPIQENNGLQPCEIDLFNKPHKIPNNCRSLIITVDRNIYHKLKYQNEWIYSVLNDTIVSSCTDLTEPQINHITGTGIIKIYDNGCQLSGKHVVLTPIEEVSNKKFIDFIPQSDMTSLLDKIPQNVHLITLKNISSYKSLKLTDLHEYSQSLNEIERQISNEEERQKHYSQHTTHSYTLYIMIVLIVIIIIMVIIIYIIIKRANLIAIGRTIIDVSTPVPSRRQKYSTQRDLTNEHDRFEAIYNVVGSRSPSPR